MNSFDRKGKRWSSEEDTTVIKLYVDEKKNIMDVAIAVHRTVGSVIARLKKEGYVPCYIQQEEYEDHIRGYKEYYNDKEFRKQEHATKKEPSSPSLLRSDNKDGELVEIKKDIREIKETLSQLSTLLFSIYEYEQ